METVKLLAKATFEGFDKGMIYLGEKQEPTPTAFIREGYRIVGNDGKLYFFIQSTFSSYFEIVPEDYEPPKFVDLKEVPTNQLVEELKIREGVRDLNITPHSPFVIETESMAVKDTGPATILVAID